jgi:L-ascorbate metabolism protein UlaG (beta-lactamase superfamily)
MDIIWYGHSCFRIKNRNLTLVTDPYDPQMVGLKLPKLEADIVTISHNHADHNFIQKVSAPKDRQLFPITGPGEYEISDCSVFGFPTYHDDQQGAQRGNNLIFIFELDDLRLAHMGDLGHQLPDELIDDVGEIDVLLLPVGGTYTLDGNQAAQLTTKIGPRMVIPMHYRLPGLSPNLAGKLTDQQPFISQLGAKVRHESRLTVKKSDLPDELEVVILEPKV